MLYNIFPLFAPLALLLPVANQPGVGSSALIDDRAASQGQVLGLGDLSGIILTAPISVPVQNQVRIERRVIIRISPRRQSARQNLMADLPRAGKPAHLVERKMEDCVEVRGIAGVQTVGSNRLVLYLRDRRMVSASLDKSCLARDFYSGFYIERNRDGMLCVGRDKLQSRSGAHCQIASFRQLVADGG